MKNLFKTLSLIGLSLSLSTNAQTGSNNAKAGQQSLTSPSDAKSAYLSNQDYLSPSSLKDYKNYYGDSLKGFDEVKIKGDLLAKGLSGSEIQGYVFTLKRNYINKKYNIGPQVVYLPIPTYPAKNNTNNQAIPGGKPIGGNNTINLAPCVNEDFESTSPGAYTTSNAVTGWTITQRTNDGACTPTNWTAGSSEFSIVATPILNWGSVGSTMGVIPNSPLGGNYIAQLNDQVNNTHMTRIAQTFPVTTANTLFQFAYAGYWQDGGAGHSCCPTAGDQPGLGVKMYDCTGAPLTCSNLSLSPGSGCQSTGVTFTVVQNVASWSNWQVKYIDLTPYVGSCVTIEIITTDCAFGGHWGSTLFDARCGGQLIGQGLGGTGGSIGGPVSFCAGSNQAQITAPVGYQTYQWYAPGTGSIAAPQGTMATLTINNPQPGSVYTVQLVAASGCVFTSTNAIVFSTVTIAGIGSMSTCAGGASGSATVAGNGSGTGYNYTWINALTTATVGTAAIVNNLAPGVYSVVLTGLGSAGCGSAVSTVTISTAPPGIISLLKPFCNNEAYLGTTGGSNFQWYNGLSPITSSLGGNLSSYTVTSPVNQSIYWLSYLSSQGCQDSVQFTLISSQAGVMTVSNIAPICPNGNNGTAIVNLAPAPGAPPGLNSYSVYAIGSTPAYSSSLSPTSANAYTPTGLSAGTYSVNVFDGSCKYSTSFVVAPYVFGYSVSPNSVTLCPGNSLQASVNFTSFAGPPAPGEFTYSWTPSNYLIGTSAQQTIVNPTLTPGHQSTIVYTVVVTPSLVNCPIAHTMSITAINPPIPTITAIPNLCNTFAPYQIITNPAGGTFSTDITGTNNPISVNGGIITPSLALITPSVGNVYTFTYGITVYTCGAINTATYSVSKFWTSALSSSVPALCVTSNPFNLMNIVQSTVNGTWSGQIPGTVSSGQFHPAGLNSGSYQISYSTFSTPNQTVCPDVTTTTVAVTKTITPYIYPVAEFCTNSAPVNMTVSPTGGGWLPAPGLSNSGVITWTNVPVPGEIATYTVSIGPCLNSNTTALFVSRFYPAGFSGTINPLCFNSSSVNLMSIVQSTTNGIWSAPYPLGVLNNSVFIPNPTIQTGTYTLTYSTTSSPHNICPDVRTIVISLLNPPTPTITQISTLCNNAAPVQLTVTPNTGHWTGSPYISANGVLTPSLTSVGNNPVQYVIGTNTCNVQQTKTITIEAFVSAAISGQIPDLCNTSPILNLTPLTVSGQGVWSGAGISGTNFNPAITGSGSFVLTHNTASSPSGLCPDQAIVSVNVYSLAIPAVTKVGPFCNSSLPIRLQVSPVGGLFGGPAIGMVSLEGEFNPAAAVIGDNIVNYSITSGPCVAYAQTTIKVEKFISADFAKPAGPFCRSNDAVNMMSYVQNPGGDWSGPGMVGSMFTPLQANSGNTNLVLYRTHSMPTASLCPDTALMRIEVRDSPTVTAYGNINAGCVPVEVIFNTPSVNDPLGQGVWTIDDGSQPLHGLEVSHIFTTPGVYHVQFNYTDAIGCKASPALTSPVSAYEIPRADFTFPDEIYISDPQIQLTNLTTILTNNTYQWKIGSLSQLPSTDISPNITFPKIGKYQVTLTATSVHGCVDEITKTIEVKNNFNIFIPNSFSPNFDGLNDYFIPVFSKEGLDMKSFDMEIFDRWGQSLYHTKDITKGWDGSIQNKGEPLKEEVYVYRIKYKDMDGNAYNKMGHLSLVK